MKKQNRKSHNILWLIIFALILAAAAGWYRFVYIPANSANEVTDFSTSILINGERKQVSFTGSILHGEPVGIGSYQVKESDGSWKFRGFAYSNGLITGYVENMPYDLVIGDDTFRVVYTGKMTNGKPSGEGTFTASDWSFTGSISDTTHNGKTVQGIMDGEAVNAPVLVKVSNKYTTTRFTGTVTNGQIDGNCDLIVKDALYSFVYNQLEYTGLYSGTIVNGMPQGDGTFTVEGAQYLTYTGRWKEGVFVGEGKLDCNNVTMKAAGESIIGTYSGETKEGLPDGNGTFSTREFVYSGEFHEGYFEGEAVCDFTDANHIDLHGTFEKGYFRPTRAELLVSLGTDPSCRFTVPEESRAFIEFSLDLFTNGTRKTAAPFVKARYNFEHFKTDQSDYYQSLTRCRLTFTGVSVDTDCYGYTLTTFTATDTSNNQYKGYYFGKNKNIAMGQTTYAYHYPFAYSADTGSSGTFITLISCLG